MPHLIIYGMDCDAEEWDKCLLTRLTDMFSFLQHHCQVVNKRHVQNFP